MTHLLRIDKIEKTYEEHTIFKNLSYNFESGKIYAIVGPSGGGKSTLLNCIGRLITLSSGKIFIDKENIEDIKILKYYREKIGYLFQNYALVDEETVLQNLNIAKKYKLKQILSSLRKFGLDRSYLNRKIYTLSGGEAQRVALTRLDLQDPLIVLADEPTGALDHMNRDLVLDSLGKMANAGKIVIIATHDDVVKEFADEKVDISQF